LELAIQLDRAPETNITSDMQVSRGRKGEEAQEVEEDNPLEAEAIPEVHNHPGQPETVLARLLLF
jgi:hypothetical protein